MNGNFAMKYKILIKKLITKFYKLMSPKAKGLRVFMYHSVIDNAQNSDNLYALDSSLFKEQMIFLTKKYKENVVRFKDLKIFKDDLSFAITFDDGYSNNLHVAAPILQNLDLPFTIFVTTDFIKSNKKGFLTINELKEISAFENVDIGSHTVSHPYLTNLNDHDAKHELIDSKHFLEDVLGKSVTLFAYPHGDYDRRIRDLVEEAGYEIARNSQFNSNIKINDKLLINSSEIWNYDSIPVFKDKIHGNWDWLKYIQN